MLLYGVLPCAAQYLSWDAFVEQLLMEHSTEEDDLRMAENLYDDYAYLHAHPININRADSTELLQLGFLNERQIEGICYYIHRYGPLRHIGELMLVPELDYHTRQLLSYFVIFGNPDPEPIVWREVWRRMLTQGRSEIIARTDIPLYRQAGYLPRTQSQLEASPSRYYMGNDLYHNLRYNYRYGNRLSWGISTEKDAGEPIFNSLTPLPDHLSGYLQIGDMGMVHNLVIGNYRLRFGQGLVMNSDFALSKSMLLQGLGTPSATIKPHRGTGESNYYTGVATTLAWHSWRFTAFASCRRLDATLKGAAISTLKTDGYHRTLTELKRKGNTRGNLFGLHLGYSNYGFHLGTTAMYQSFDRRFAPPTQEYKRYAPQGHAFLNASVDYAWHHHRLSLSGETAIDGKGSLATLNILRLKVVDNLHLTLLQRYYAHDYWALEAKSFATSSDIRGERGIYLGAQWQPHRQLQLTAYADTYRFPFLRYRVSAPSYGTDGQFMSRYSINRAHSIMLRYRFRLKQRDVAEGYRLPHGGLLNEWIHRLHAQWEGTLSPTFTMRAFLEGCLVTAEKQSQGFMASLQATYASTIGLHTTHFAVGITAFHSDYVSRLYSYERGLLYAYNYQTYYGTGLRGYLLAQYTHSAVPRLTATAKFATTHYNDRPTIGSGAAMIDANHRENIQLQLRYTF